MEALNYSGGFVVSGSLAGKMTAPLR